MKNINTSNVSIEILDCVPVGLCLLRKDFVVLFWNSCLETWTKISRTEIVGTKIIDRFPHLQLPKYQLRFEKIFEQGVTAIFSPQLHEPLIPCLLPNGKQRIQNVTVNPVPAFEGEGFYGLLTIEDVTNATSMLAMYHKELKERKQIQEELERSNADLEQFAYIASHDLREPLRISITFSQLLQQSYSQQLDAEADKIINFIVEAAKRMQALITDVLEYSQVNTNRKPFKPTDSNEVLETTLFNLKLLLEETGTIVKVGNLPTVIGDKFQLVLLFQNLIDNAIKYRNSNQIPEIEIDAKAENGEWLFSVKDNGIGISSQYFERIFKIFQRLHSKEEYPGTGIGLAICQKIVRLHGGKIWVESESGKGATFLFTLPSVESLDVESNR